MNQTTLQRREVVTAFLTHHGLLLLVRRSGRVGSYRGRWSAVSGYLEDPTPLEQAWREIREETGLESGVRLLNSAPPLEVPDSALGVCWVVHPFLFAIDDPQRIRLDWENTELVWVTPAELSNRETVPALTEALALVWEANQ